MEKEITTKVFQRLMDWAKANPTREVRIDLSGNAISKVYVNSSEFGTFSLKFVKTGDEDFTALIKDDIEKRKRQQYAELKAYFEPEMKCDHEECGMGIDCACNEKGEAK